MGQCACRTARASRPAVPRLVITLTACAPFPTAWKRENSMPSPPQSPWQGIPPQVLRAQPLPICTALRATRQTPDEACNPGATTPLPSFPFATRSQTHHLTRIGSPRPALSRLSWQMQSYCILVNKSRRQNTGHREAVGMLNTVVESASALIGQKTSFRSIESVLVRFLAVASAEFRTYMFGQAPQDAASRVQTAWICLSEATPPRLRVPVQNLPSPYTPRLLRLLAELAQTPQCAMAVNRSRLTSAMVRAIKMASSATAETLADLSIKVNTLSAAPPRKAPTPRDRTHSQAETVRSFLASASSESDENEDVDDDTSPSEQPRPDAKRTAAAAAARTAQIDPKTLIMGAVREIESFLCQMARYPSTGIELMRSNTLESLFLELLAPDPSPKVGSLPCPLRDVGRRVCAGILEQLARRSFAQNIGELTTFLRGGHIKRLIDFIRKRSESGHKRRSRSPATRDGKRQATPPNFLSSATSSSALSSPIRGRPAPPVPSRKNRGMRRHRVNVAMRGRLLVRCASLLKHLLAQTNSTILMSEFKHSGGYHALLQSTLWLSKQSEQRFNRDLEEDDADAFPSRAARSGFQPKLREELMSVLLGCVAEMVYSGPKRLAIPSEKTELAGFEHATSTQTMGEWFSVLLRCIFAVAFSPLHVFLILFVLFFSFIFGSLPRLRAVPGLHRHDWSHTSGPFLPSFRFF